MRLQKQTLGLVIAKDWEYGNGYKLCCKNKPNFMKDEKYLWGDKAQIFWHLRNKFFYFCIKDIDDFFNKYGVNHELSLIKVELETGRHHQIRLQMSNIGHPLYGDQRYGTQDKKQLALYAYKLEFTHPVTKEQMTFKKLPEWKILEGVDL